MVAVISSVSSNNKAGNRTHGCQRLVGGRDGVDTFLLSSDQFLLHVSHHGGCRWLGFWQQQGEYPCLSKTWWWGVGMGWTVLCCLPSNSFSMYRTVVAFAGWVSGKNKVGNHSCQRFVGGGW